MATIPRHSHNLPEGMRVVLIRDHASFRSTVRLVFYLNSEPTYIEGSLNPWYYESCHTATEAIMKQDHQKQFVKLLVKRYFNATMTPPDRVLEGQLAQAIYESMQCYVYETSRDSFHIKESEPSHIPEEVKSAIDIADEGMKLQKEIIEKTTTYQQKVKKHYEKYGQLLPR